jgi:hypothetical protein
MRDPELFACVICHIGAFKIELSISMYGIECESEHYQGTWYFRSN